MSDDYLKASSLNMAERSKNFKEIKSGIKTSNNVYLVFPDVQSFHGVGYHPGLASIAAVLVENGVNVKAGYVTTEEQFDEIVEDIISFEPIIVGFTTVETQFKYVQEIAARLKEKYACMTVVGGTHISLWPQAVVEPNAVSLDCGMRGESEYAFLELVRKVQKGEDHYGVNNLVFTDPKTGELVTNPMNPQVEKLEVIPHPKTDIFEFQDIINTFNTAYFHFNRGCPYPCTYCSARELGLQYGPLKESIRRRSVNNVIEEIKLTVEMYDMSPNTLLFFTDDLFTLSKKWLYDFLARYEKEIARPFWCCSRSNLASPELFDRLKSAGCRTVMMSVESGNDFVRNEVMKRGVSRKALYNSFELAKKYDIETCAPCVIGVPFETPEMIEDSIKTLSELDPTHKGINIFYPYQGAPLRKVCADNGFLPEVVDFDFRERSQSVLNLPTITKEQISYYFENWESLVYSHKGTRQRVGNLIRTYTRNSLNSDVGKKIRPFLRKNPQAIWVKEKVYDLFDVK
jgi:anaerobic magnesium-protoporphyrin IX monomethyl ester cyclase